MTNGASRWQTTKAAGVACGVCGKSGKCKVSPDGAAFLCWPHGGKVHQMNGHARVNGTGYVGAAHRKAGTKGNGPAHNGAETAKVFATADAAIAAAGAALTGAVLAVVYVYATADGVDAFRVGRFHLPDGSKSFRPVCPCKGGWKIGDPDGQLPLYHLDYIPDAGVIYVAEGEKAADAGWSVGLPTFTSAHGSGQASRTDWSLLAGRDVAILPDNDEPGRKYARAVAKILVGLEPPARVKIVELLGLPAGGDVVEFIAAEPGTEPASIGIMITVFAEAVPWLNPADLIGGPVLLNMSDVQPQSITWLWPGRIPLGRQSMLVGSPGCGKSYLTCDLAAHVSTGSDWPDGSSCERGPVLFVTAEDDAADTIRPRLDACGADVSMVHQLAAVRRIDDETGKPRDLMFTLADVVNLEAAMKAVRPLLVVIDPIGSFLGGGVDSHRDNEVRGVLAPIGLLANKYGAAVLLIAHRRKGNAGSADETALGSRAFTGIVRTVWHLSRDADVRERRLLLPGKNNLAPEGDGLAFTLIGQPTAAVVWENSPVTMTADDAMHAERKAEANGSDDAGKPGPKPKAQDAAAEWLLAVLADLAEHRVDDIRKATKDAGLSWRTVQRARESIGVLVEKGAFHGGWIWRLPKPAADAKPADAVPPAQPASPTPAATQPPWKSGEGNVRVVPNGGTGTELRDTLADMLKEVG